MLEPAAWQEIVDTITFPLIKLLGASVSDLGSGTAENTTKQDRKRSSWEFCQASSGNGKSPRASP